MLIMYGRYIREVVKKSDESLKVEANKTRGRCIKSLRSIQKYPEQGKLYELATRIFVPLTRT